MRAKLPLSRLLQRAAHGARPAQRSTGPSSRANWPPTAAALVARRFPAQQQPAGGGAPRAFASSATPCALRLAMDDLRGSTSRERVLRRLAEYREDAAGASAAAGEERKDGEIANTPLAALSFAELQLEAALSAMKSGPLRSTHERVAMLEEAVRTLVAAGASTDAPSKTSHASALMCLAQLHTNDSVYLILLGNKKRKTRIYRG